MKKLASILPFSSIVFASDQSDPEVQVWQNLISSDEMSFGFFDQFLQDGEDDSDPNQELKTHALGMLNPKNPTQFPQ